MASTNKTTHYELSQYVSTDKPTYLTDYNNDMSAIDTGIYNAQSKADSGYSLATSADGKADTAITNAGTAQTDASTAITRIGTLANLTTTEKTNLVGAINEVNYNLGLFNLGTASALTVTPSAGTLTGSLSISKNSNGSLFKCYGNLTVTGATGTNNITYTTSDTGLRPSASYTINCMAIRNIYTASNVTSTINGVDVTVNTNGTLTFETAIASGSYDNVRIVFPPCLYFNSDFGDTPIPE